jgi:hypothetical protein
MLTTAQQVRLRIQDLPAVADVTRTFDGSASAFNLEHRNLTSGTAYVPDNNAAWSATGVSFNTSGYVTFSAVGSANSAFRARYVHSVFSDADISHFTAVGGSIPGAAIEAVQALMFDGLKRAKWAAPDGTTYDDTQALDALWKIYSAQKEEIAASETLDGGFESWALGQDTNW